jgi:frataxin
MDQNSFPAVADEALEQLMEMLEDAVGDRLDVDLQGGILTIELESGGQYVINKHAPNRQIWMSSPVSGATHFDFDNDGDWVGTRGQGKLHEILANELSAATGTTVRLPVAQ